MKFFSRWGGGGSGKTIYDSPPPEDLMGAPPPSVPPVPDAHRSIPTATPGPEAAGEAPHRASVATTEGGETAAGKKEKKEKKKKRSHKARESDADAWATSDAPAWPTDWGDESAPQGGQQWQGWTEGAAQGDWQQPQPVQQDWQQQMSPSPAYQYAQPDDQAGQQESWHQQLQQQQQQQQLPPQQHSPQAFAYPQGDGQAVQAGAYAAGADWQQPQQGYGPGPGADWQQSAQQGYVPGADWQQSAQQGYVPGADWQQQQQSPLSPQQQPPLPQQPSPQGMDWRQQPSPPPGQPHMPVRAETAASWSRQQAYASPQTADAQNVPEGPESANVVRPGDLDWIKPMAGTHQWLKQSPPEAFDDPLLRAGLGIRRVATGRVAEQSADEWLNSLVEDAQQKLAENQIMEFDAAAGGGRQVRTTPTTEHLQTGSDGKVYSGPLSWVASPSAITAFLGQSEIRQSVSMIQQISAAETVLRSELRHEVGRVREQLELERFNAIQQQEETKRLQATCLELAQRLENTHLIINRLQQESQAEDFRLTKSMELSNIEREESLRRTQAAQVQLEIDTRLLNQRLEVAMTERNDFMTKSNVLQTRLEEEQRKTSVENAGFSARLVAVEQQVTTALSLANKRILKESDSQTMRDTGSLMTWGIEPKRMEKYEHAFVQADTDQDGYVSAAEARTILDRSGLPQAELSNIWSLADNDRDGRLTAGEFIVALHLTYKRSKEGVPIPPALPLELRALLSEGMAQRFPTIQNNQPAPDAMYANQPQDHDPSASAQVIGDAIRDGIAAVIAAQPPPPPMQMPAPPPKTEIQVIHAQPPPQPPPPPQQPRVVVVPAPAPAPPAQSPAAMLPQQAAQAGMRPQAVSFVPTAEEITVYRDVFAGIDTDGDGFISGLQAKDLLDKSGLPERDLMQIWSLSDMDKDNQLSLAEFLCANVLVDRRRNHGAQLPQSMPPELISAVHAAIGSTQGAAVSWSLTAAEVQKWAEYFTQLEGGTGMVTGPDAVQLLEQSGLPKTDLQHIWTLADAGQDGNLSLGEFICAMALVDRRLQGAALPRQLPPELGALLAPGALSALSAPTLSAAAPAAAAPPAEAAPAGSAGEPDWVPQPPEELAQYRQIFASLAKGKPTVDPQEAMSVLKESGVPIHEVSQLCNMADMDKDGRFTKGEFIAAMALVNHRRGGGALLQAVPKELIAAAQAADKEL